MNLDEFLTYCQAKMASKECLPFGPDTLVLKVAGKVYASTGLERPDFRVNLKCDPSRAVVLREQYPDVIVPGWHMNKKHWNTVYLELGELDDRFVKELVDHSYALVVGTLSKKVREEHGLA